MTPELLHNASVRNDAGVFFETYARIWPKDRGGGLVRPRSNRLQKRIQEMVRWLKDNNFPIRLIGLKPRQKGSTTYYAVLDYTEIRRRSVSVCVIGGQYSQTEELWKMIQTYQNEDRFDWGNNGEVNAKEGKWSNGSRLKPETANDKLAGVAGTFQVLHATEVARWARYGVANAADVLTNILKCVPLLPDTTVILESTAEGAAGDFYTRWLNAVDSEDVISGRVKLQPGQFVRVFAAWFEFEDSAMRLTPEQKREIERTLDAEDEYTGEKELIERYGNEFDGHKRLGTAVEDFDLWEQLAWRRWAIREECKRDRHIFDRDYPHSWQDAFLKSGNLRFNQTGVSVLRKRLGQRVPMNGILENSKNGERVTFRPTEIGEAQVTIFEKPVIGRRYILPIDPMTGATQVGGLDPDFHGAFVLRAGYYEAGTGRWTKPATVARIVPCRWDIDVLENAAWKLARFYGPRSGCKIVIEMNQDRGLTELFKLRGADLYQREKFNEREQRLEKALGFMTTEKTRESLVECLASGIREWDSPGNGIDIFCPHAIEQAENFVRKLNGRSEAAEGFHDDDLFSIMLGLLLIDQATTLPLEMYGNGIPFDLREQGGMLNPQGSAFS